jgi:hypothetical protein
MSIFSSPRFLRTVMLADAATCLATGALQGAFADPLAGWLGLPAALLAATGWFLLGYAAVAAYVGTRQPVPRAPVAVFAVGNLAWGIACLALLAGSWVSPTALGTMWVLAQAVTVFALAELQRLGLKRDPIAGWA